jgi:NAD+ kinase
MHRIGILYLPRRPETLDLAEALGQRLTALGASVWLDTAWDEETIVQHSRDTDLVVTLGGDGTIVRVGRILAPCGVPLVGVNFGRLGFLAEMEPGEALDLLPQVLDGHYRLEERMMVHAEWTRGGQGLGSFDALQDVFVGRGAVPKALRLSIIIDDHEFTTYIADGAVVASPTGSTAYALSGGGPVVVPQLRALVFVPIAAHLARIRSLVLPPEARVSLEVHTDYDAVLTFDGQQHHELHDGDRVTVTGSPHSISFVKLQPANHFYETLLEKLR